MQNHLPQPRSVASMVASAGACWVCLVAVAFVGLTVLALVRFIADGDGIVMLPLLLIFSVLLCSPGAVAWGLGTLLMRDRNRI